MHPPQYLYSWVFVDSLGSRILVVVESLTDAERLRAGQLVKKQLGGKGRRGRQKSIRDTDIPYVPEEGVMVEADDDRRDSSIILTRNKVKHVTNGNNDGQSFGQIPWRAITFAMCLPKLTLKWTSQTELIVALHLTNIKVSTLIAPSMILRECGGPKGLRKCLVTGSTAVAEIKTPHQKKLAGDAQKRDYLDFKTHVFTDSRMFINLSVGQIHCDHFVEGDIPVIMKSTNIALDSSAVDADDFGDAGFPPFLLIKTTKFVVDPSFAPIYDTIEVSAAGVVVAAAHIYWLSVQVAVTPLAVNVEVLVVEQLMAFVEKEMALLQASSPIQKGRLQGGGDREDDGVVASPHDVNDEGFAPPIQSRSYDRLMAKSLSSHQDHHAQSMKRKVNHSMEMRRSGHPSSQTLRRCAQRLFESRSSFLFVPSAPYVSHWLILPTPRLAIIRTVYYCGLVRYIDSTCLRNVMKCQ